MNAVLFAVVAMLILSLLRVHVVVALFIGALTGGLMAGMGLDGTLLAFQDGLGGGAKIALSYALLGAFAMGVAATGLPSLLANFLLKKINAGRGDTAADSTHSTAATATKWILVCGIIAMAVMSQNLIPVHIAFIPLLVPPLLGVMNRLHLDRRLVTCCITFGLVTTYMFIPVGFGSIYLNDILLYNINEAGLDTSGINVMKVMAFPALGMLVGVLIAIFFSYRKPRQYADAPLTTAAAKDETVSTYKVAVALVAIVATFVVQIVMQAMNFEADGLLVGALTGLGILLVTGAVNFRSADDIFSQGMKMMALIGFIMITAQGFAAVMTATGQVEALVTTTGDIFGDNKFAAAGSMLLVGLIVTMGIGSSFSTLPVITVIFVPLATTLGFSPAATIALVGTAGALGDAGSPASDSTLGPTSGLNADGQHDHVRDSVIPTFIHFNIPLLIAGWAAAMIL